MATHLPRRRPECARRCLPLVTVHVSRLWTLSRGSYLRQRRDWSWGTHGGRPVLRVLRPTVVRPFESDLEHAAQGHAEVRIGVTTCHQGNPSMPDAAVAHRELVRVHGPRDRASSPPRRSALLGSSTPYTEFCRSSVELERLRTPQLLRVHNGLARGGFSHTQTEFR